MSFDIDIDLYHEFWRKCSTSKNDFVFNGEGDRLADNTPPGQALELSRLEQIADHHDLDGWMDYIVADATFPENQESLINAEKSFQQRSRSRSATDTPFQKDKEAYIEKFEALEKQREELKQKISELDEELVTTEDGLKAARDEYIRDTVHSALEEELATTYEKLKQSRKEYFAEQSVDYLSEDVGINSDNEKNKSVTGDEYDYASIGSAPVSLIDLLDRIKDEHGLPSRRAVIEFLVAQDAIVDNFEEDEGKRWPEWEDAIQASNLFALKRE